MGKKTVIIVGGGVSGLTTGIYLQKNGYDTLILEKNATLGGACIGWERKGCYIDGCIHWLVGVHPKSSLYPLWRETGALSEDTPVFIQDDFYTLDFGDGKRFTFWKDLDKTQAELIAFAPEDEKQIKQFCKWIRKFKKVNPPVDKPVDLMGLIGLCKVAFTLGPVYPLISKVSKLSCKEYAERFKNPYLRRWIREHLSADYNLMSLLYMLGHVTSDDGGVPIGGSVAMVERMKKNYLALGGKIRVGAEVERIDVENGVAVGVTLKNGEKLLSDWVVSSAPIERVLKEMLGGKYAVKKIDDRLGDRDTYPIYTYTTVAFKIHADMKGAPLSHKIYVDDPIVLDKAHHGVVYRNYSYDQTLKTPEGYVIVQATVSGNDDMYFWWKELKDKGEYEAKKQEIADKMQAIYLTKYPELAGKIQCIDVLTPLTYERYLHGRHGSFQSFVQTNKGKALMQKGEIKGLKNFVLSGQWILRSGGLPPAVITGKFAAQRICKKDKVKFKNK